MVKADNVPSISEGTISNVVDMAALCVVMFDHASTEIIPNGTCIRIDRAAWNLLGFAIHHQRELAKTLFDAFEAGASDGEVSS
jgi:hypothetical protein